MKSAFFAVLALAALASAAPASHRHRHTRRRQCHAPTTTQPPVETTPVETTPIETPPVTAPPVETPPPSGGGGGKGGPVFSVYADVEVSADAWPTVADLGDWNDFLLAFYLTDGRNAFDIAAVWEGMDAAKKEQVVKEYHAAGKTIRVSLFGATDMPLQHGGDPVAIGKQVAQFVKDNKLDGVDVDYEDSASFNAAGDGENFLISLTKTLRSELPAPYVISHAPQSPYFTTAGWYPQGAYNKVHAEVGSMIDFYNMQWYNQGDGMYESCDGLFKGDSTTIPGTSFNEIVAQGVPANKINIGKPAGPNDASNGYMTPQMIGECISNASQKPGGVMSWEWHNAKADWIAAAKGDL